MKLSACIEWLFADEAESFGDRIRLARKNGVEAVEFWKWTNKDLDEIEAAL
jgi:hydroxypyruvate isomerase